MAPDKRNETHLGSRLLSGKFQIPLECRETRSETTARIYREIFKNNVT